MLVWGEEEGVVTKRDKPNQRLLSVPPPWGRDEDFLNLSNDDADNLDLLILEWSGKARMG